MLPSSLLYSVFVKRETFSKLMQQAYANDTKHGNDNEINVIIDIPSIIAIYADRGDFDVSDNRDTLVTSVLNTAAWYKRLLSGNPWNVKVNIFLVYSKNTPMYAGLCIETKQYKSIWSRRKAARKKWEEQNIAILKVICQYIPGVKFIYTDGFVKDAIMSITQLNREQGNNFSNIILTKDPLVYPIFSMIPTKTVIIRPRKDFIKGGTESEDVSFIINKDNLISAFLFNRKQRIDDSSYLTMLAKCNDLHSSFYPAVISLAGDSVYGIRAPYLNIVDTISDLNRLVSSGLYPNVFNPANASSLESALVQLKSRPFIGLSDMIKMTDPFLSYESFKRAGLQINRYDPDMRNDKMLFELNKKLSTEIDLDVFFN